MSRIMADIWGERAPKGLSEDLDAWQYWQCPLRVGGAEHKSCHDITWGAQDLCVGIVNSVTRSNREVKGLCSSASSGMD